MVDVGGGRSPIFASHGLALPIWRDRKSTPKGFDADASMFGVATIRQ